MLTDRKLSDIAVGKLLVDRNVLLEIIYSMQYSMGPGVSLEEVYEFEKRCMSLAQECWIELLFDLLLKPPVGYEEFEADGWDAQIWMLLQSASEKFPRTGLEVALLHFPGEGERMRAAILAALGGAGDPEGFPYVDAYFEPPDRLTWSEITLLIEAYGGIGDERSLQRLSEIPKRLSDEKMQEWYLTQAIDFAVKDAGAGQAKRRTGRSENE